MNSLCRRLSIAVLVLIAGCQQPVAQRAPSEVTPAAPKPAPSALAAALRADVEYMASEECGGRLTGSPGAARAAEYIAKVFRNAGLQPAGEVDAFFQPFEFTAGVKMTPGKNDMAIVDGAGSPRPCELDKDFRPLAFSANGTAEGEVVFVGYGLVEPQSAGKGYDSYAGLDVNGKIVLALRHLPENASPQRRQELSLYAQDRYKAKLAADRGAKGILLVTGPNSPKPGELVKLREDDRESSGPIVAVSVSGDLANRLLSAAGLDLKSLQTLQDGEQANPHAPSAVAGARVRVSVELERVRRTCNNVLAVLPPTGGVNEYVMLGAHYDHIGNGIGLGSLARQGEEGRIHLGADDNASGVAALLELAAAAAEAWRNGDPGKPQRGMFFACWSGEELGLIGSSHFVIQPIVPLDKVVAYL
ncbi:MAG TPA: M28 family peptidase, partial [Phycisphaerae bacterium]|nr:M28 family peptidase [Phycisphaerae bacterium]